MSQGRIAPTGCTCPRTRRNWLLDGTCGTCGHNVLEEQIAPLVLTTLCGGTGVTLWRNARGFDTHFPSGEKRKGPIRYGVGDGGADYLGPCGIPGEHFGKFLAVETKTPIKGLQPNQRNFGTLVARLGGVYAVARSEQNASELLAYLQGTADRPSFVFTYQESK